MTYDINIHFYNLPEDPNGEPTILWVGDVTDPFVPFPKERLMLNAVQDREKIDIFLDKLVNLHNLEQKKNMPQAICTGAAISSAKQLIQEDGKNIITLIQLIGGRILVFSSNLSTVGFGPVHVRDDPKLYNTPNEKNLLHPDKDTYVKLA